MTAPLNRREACDDRYELVIGSAMPIRLEPADIQRQNELEIEDKRRFQVIQAAVKEYEDNRAVIDEKFPGMSLAQWIDSALQGEHLPTLDEIERISWGG